MRAIGPPSRQYSQRRESLSQAVPTSAGSLAHSGLASGAMQAHIGSAPHDGSTAQVQQLVPPLHERPGSEQRPLP
jgi:hypothetical protein